MKIIKLLGSTPLDNVLGACTLIPNEIIFFGFAAKDNFLNRDLPALERFFAKKGLQNIRTSYVAVPHGDIGFAVRSILGLADGGVCVDITGGDSLLCSAAGIAHEKNPEVSIFSGYPQNRFSVFISRSGKGYDVSKLNNTVEENALLHGGELALPMGGEYDYTPEFLSDLNTLWQLCFRGPDGYVHKRSAPQTWNRFSVTVSGIERSAKGEQLARLSKYKVRTYLENLKKAGLVSYTVRGDGTLAYLKYKNEQIKSCINKAGNLLEQKVYLTCKRFLGRGVNDVGVGVVLKWNSERVCEAYTENEIDVFVMRGLIPVFISCKNGKFESEELYKLSSVAERFGGKYAKKVLVVSDLDNMSDARTVKYLRARAKEMDIVIIDGLNHMSDNSLEKKLKNAIFR